MSKNKLSTNLDELPMFMTQREFREKVFPISENKFLEILRREDALKIFVGKKYMTA